MTNSNRDIEEPLLQQAAGGSIGNVQSDVETEGFGSVINADFEVSEGGEPLRGTTRLNSATATLAATVIGTEILLLPEFFTFFSRFTLCRH